MIHPGTGGCEAYASLANRLNNQFSCYGVDSYNLYHNNKIEDIDALAEYYLSYIEETMKQTGQEVYHLLGWSLGGQISLKIAHILEQKNIRMINLYLLDTVLIDKYLLSLSANVNIKEEENKFREYMITEGYDKAYVEKAVSIIEIEGKFSQQRLVSPLSNAQILLFKAILEDTRFAASIAAKQSEEHILQLKYNNIETVVKNKKNLKVINVKNAHHGNILQQEELIIKVILDPVKI